MESWEAIAISQALRLGQFWHACNMPLTAHRHVNGKPLKIGINWRKFVPFHPLDLQKTAKNEGMAEGSILFPPWYMAPRPGKQVLAASHTTELAERWGRKVRGMIAEYAETLGCSLSPVSNAAGRWELSNGAEYFAAGVGGGIAGFRADLAVIDDPLRSREDADSELNR